MKKTLLGAIAMILVALLYYFTVGSKQITEEIKKGVNSAVLELNSNGFRTQKKKITQTKEHIEIELNNTQKIENLLKNHGFTEIDREKLMALEGAVIGVDIVYNPSPTKAIAMDIYPIKTPTLFNQYIKDDNGTKIKKRVEELLKSRAILTHIEINKLATAFDGYLKDINIDNEIKILGVKFNGDIKLNSRPTIKSIYETIDRIEIKSIEDNMLFRISNVKATIKNPLEEFKKQSRFSIESIEIKNVLFSQKNGIVVKNLHGESYDRVGVNSLIDSKLKLNISELNITSQTEPKELLFKNLSLESDIKNADMEIFKRLNNMEKMSDEKALKEFKKVFQKLAKDKFKIEIKNFSIANIQLEKSKIEGFDLTASIFLDDSIDISTLNSDNIFDAFNLKLNLEASNELVSAISSNPNAMVLMMILQPIDKNGKKVYNIEYSKGSLKINGKPFL